MKESAELSPLELAEQRIPTRWYERFFDSHPLVTYAGLTGLPVGYNLLYILFGPRDLLQLHFIAGGLFIFSHMTDIISTIKCYNANENASKEGVQTFGEEGSLFMKHIKTSREFVRSPMTYLTSIFGIGASFVFPGIGFPFTCMKITASLNNFTKANRYNLAAEIARYNQTSESGVF